MLQSENSKKTKRLSIGRPISKRGVIVLAMSLVIIGGLVFALRGPIGRTISSVYSQLTDKYESEEIPLKNADVQDETDAQLSKTADLEATSEAEQFVEEDPSIETELTDNITNVATPNEQENNPLRDADID